MLPPRLSSLSRPSGIDAALLAARRATWVSTSLNSLMCASRSRRLRSRSVDVQPAAAQQLAQLLHAGAVDMVEVEQLADLGQREAEPLAAQDPAEPRAVAGAVEPGQALAARLDQALVLVEADGARGDARTRGPVRRCCRCARVARRGAFGRKRPEGRRRTCGSVIVDVYVNVNAGPDAGGEREW